jgi:TonB-linked SusC/RagA family outer membrane protein
MATLRYGCRSRALGGFAALTIFWASGLAAQTGSIAGRVIDAQNGQTIPAAQVFISDLDIGVLTQQNGSYILLNVPAGQRTVTVQRIGYREVEQTVTVTAGETTVLDFRISEEALQLDEIIITGTPGGSQRRAIGNTVTSVEVSSVAQDVALTSMQDLLTGRTPGLRYSVVNGNVGTGSGITIRGVGSFATERSRPLIFVDGVRVNNDSEAGPTIGEGDQVNVLDDFNPEDIESVEIIKGPAAASLYGTEASAGVIQIITKKGREGTPEFNFSVRQGVNYIRDPAGRLGQLWTCPLSAAPGTGVAGVGAAAPCQTEAELAPYNMYEEANYYIQNPTFDADGDGVADTRYFEWPSENLYQNGHSQSYNLDVRGGTQTVRYFLSGNYDNEEGAEWWNTDETYRLRGNVGVVFSERFSLDVSTGYVDGKTRFAAPTVGDGGIWQDLVWSNGYYLQRITPFDLDSNVAGRDGPDPRRGGFEQHLPTDLQDIESTREYSRFTGSATLNFTSGDFDFGNVVASLSSRAVVGVDKSWDTNVNVYPVEVGPVPDHLLPYTSTWASVDSETANGTMNYERPIQTNLSFDYALTANLEVADAWGFASSFGAQYYVDERDEFRNSGTGFASPLSRTINQLSQSQLSNFYELVTNKSLGFYVQEEVSWNDRIFLTGAVRFDDNSTFGVDAKSQKYPKVSGAWVVSEESFWNVDLVNSLRLRGAWGKAGRQPSSTAGQNIYVAWAGPGGTSAIRPSSPGNPAILPEVSTELELGFDVALLDDRLSGEFTHYWKQTDQALRPLPLAPSGGFPGSVDQNVGRIDNWGWEATLSARVYESDALSFDLDLSADYTDNEIKDLCAENSLGDLQCYLGSSEIAIGLPYPNNTIGDHILDAGFENDPNVVPVCTAALLAAGTRCTSRANAFDTRLWSYCDPGVDLGPPQSPTQPRRYGRVQGGAAVQCENNQNRNLYAGRGFATHTFSVAPRISLLGNQLQIYALAEGQYGRWAQDSGHTWGHNYRNSKVSRLQNDAVWVASDLYNGTSSEQYTKGLYDADFWKLRELGARYNLPQSWVERTGASRASVALSARNLWTIWVAQEEIYGLPVADPEYGDPTNLDGGGNFYSTPPFTTLNVMLRVTF